MCGRFAQSLTASQYREIVDAQLYQEQRERQRQGKEKEQDASASQPGKEGSSSQKDKSHAPADEELALQSSDDDFYPSFNVAPGSRVPVVRLAEPHPMRDAKEEHVATQTLTIQSMRWGLLPHYTTSVPRGPDALRTINARDDAVLSGRSMWTPILRSGKRCVVFCQGFYEWLKKDDGAQRIAHFVGMKDEGRGRVDVDGHHRALMPMAGLYESCQIDGEEVLSFTIITTESNKQLNFLHDRMPVILPDRAAIRTWLGLMPATSDKICGLLRPYAAGQLDVYRVPTEVGRVGNNDANFILPVSARKDGIAAAFGRAKQSKPVHVSTEVQADATSETHAPLEEEVKGMQDGHENQDAAENTKDDAALAEKLQEEENRRVDVHKGSSSDPERALPPDETASQSTGKRKREETAQSTASSKWSPDPFHPPVSPPRPYGGYSTVDEHGESHRTPNKTPMQAARGGGPGTGIESPSKSPFAARRRQEERFKEAAKGTKDIRNFFGGS